MFGGGKKKKREEKWADAREVNKNTEKMLLGLKKDTEMFERPGSHFRQI